MAFNNEVSGAQVVLPKNALPGVVGMQSNKTIIITTPNPDTAGEDLTPVRVYSAENAAEIFKPEKRFTIQKVLDLAAEKPVEADEVVCMQYGKDPSKVMKDFTAEYLVIKAVDENGESPLFRQRIDYYTLEHLLRLCEDPQFQEKFNDLRDAIIQALEAEISFTEELIKDQVIDDTL